MPKENANCIYKGHRYLELNSPKRKVIKLQPYYFQGGKWHKTKVVKTKKK